MTASDATSRQVLAILRQHLDKTTLREILSQLRAVPGNRSFRDTISLLFFMNEATP